MYDVWLRITKLIGSNFFHTQKIIRLQYITKSTYLFIPTPLHHSSPRSQIYRYYTINSNFLTFFNLLCASDFKPLSAMELTGGLMIKLTRRKPKKASILASLKLILNGSLRRHFPPKGFQELMAENRWESTTPLKPPKITFKSRNEEESKIFFLLNLVHTTCNHKMLTSDGSGMYPK